LENLIIYRCVVGSRAYGLDSDDFIRVHPCPSVVKQSLVLRVRS
jgi:hypothetical protein